MLTPGVRHGYAAGAEGNRLHFLDFGGKGPQLVCLHGVTGNAWNWHAVATGIRGRRRVSAVDLRGYGESQWSASHAYRTDDHVADLAALVDGWEEERVDVMGSSWGALIALQYAAENPGRVGRLVVVDVEPSFAQGETDLFPRPTSHADMEEVKKGVAAAYPNADREMVELTAALCFGPVEGGRLAPKHDPFFFERWPFRSDDHWDRLERLEAPVLYVHAAGSFVKGEVMEQMAERTPDGRLAEVADSSHVVPVDNPAGLVVATLPFL